MVDGCGRFMKAFKDGEKPRWISLLGEVGTGKTHCANRMWGRMERKYEWHNFRYFHEKIYWPAMVQDLRSAEQGDGNWQRFIEMRSWPVLFLDDIGAERDNTGFASEQLNTILGCRVGKWTIITSNLLLDQLAKIDPRIADRIIREPGNEFVELNCESYGLKKQLNILDHGQIL